MMTCPRQQRLLLPPAGLGWGLPTSSSSSSLHRDVTLSSDASNSMFITAQDRRALRVQGQQGLLPRPPIRRTASTASVNDEMDLNVVPFVDLARVIDAGDISSDDEPGLGNQDDWERDVGDDDDGDDGDDGDDDDIKDDDPFTATPPRTSSSPPSSPSRMRLDPPRSGPIVARRHPHQHQKPTTNGKGRPARIPHQSKDEADRDDVANNPFLGRPTVPSAPKKRKQAEGKPNRVSYVFRGKRITYDAPLESLFPQDDSEDEALSQALNLNSGPRVLFPPLPSNPATESPSRNVSPPASSNALRRHLMQTPRRQPKPSASAMTAFVTPAITNSLKKLSGPANDGIPPTPASLPQKPKDNEASSNPFRGRHDPELERERFNQAFRGIQAASAQAHQRFVSMSDGAKAARRYTPYPPR